MSATIAKTYRIPAGIHNLLINEAERLKTNEADVVRLAIRRYFDDRQSQDRLEACEQRLTASITAQGERLGQLIGQILSLAQPQ
ncbi:hypothetical protein [Ferrovum sp.]|uniref:hypothetical protein n=1 Tax=Ferrovum sp. TaxID=2609467 RepID=UPI002615DDA1|nr:hypothetical protein [Ferrovum sp.]